MRKTSKTIRLLGRAAARPLTGMGSSGSVEDMLAWEIEDRDDLVIVVVSGELDIHSAPGLGEALTPAADAGRHLILDLAALRFCDCAGLSMFLRTQHRARAAGGSLQLAALTASMRRLIAVARMTGILPVTTSVADTIAMLERGGTPGPPRPRPGEPGEPGKKNVS